MKPETNCKVPYLERKPWPMCSTEINVNDDYLRDARTIYQTSYSYRELENRAKRRVDEIKYDCLADKTEIPGNEVAHRDAFRPSIKYSLKCRKDNIPLKLPRGEVKYFVRTCPDNSNLENANRRNNLVAAIMSHRQHLTEDRKRPKLTESLFLSAM